MAPEADPHFFVSRYASSAATARLIYRAVESIRALYPDARVAVVEDGSPPEFAYAPEPLDGGTRPDSLTTVVPNPYPRSGEMGALRVAWSTLACASDAASAGENAVAVTMHDGMVLTHRLDRDGPLLRDHDVRFLWHFDRYFAMHLPETLRLLSHLTLPPADHLRLTAAFAGGGFNAVWNGCFGVALAANGRGLDRMHRGCGLFGHAFMSAVAGREARQAAERVVGLAAHAFAGSGAGAGAGAAPPSFLFAGEGLIPSVCGCIFDHPDPWSTATAGHSLDRIKRIEYAGPVFKTWAGR